MPLPFGFVRSMGRSSSRITSIAWEAKASFSSIVSMSWTVRPVRSMTFFTGGLGPTPMYFGSIPAKAYPTSRPQGRKPRCWASLASITTTAAAAAFIPEAVPAVPVPFAVNAGGGGNQFGIAQALAPAGSRVPVGTAAHDLGPSRHVHAGIARRNQLGRRHDGLQAAATQAIEREGRRFDRKAAIHRRDPCQIDVTGIG